MNLQDGHLTIEELSREVENLLRKRGIDRSLPDNRVSSVPDTRTIRYYTTLGLLDRPSQSGRHAHYGKRHVLQLMAVKALQALALPLSRIQEKLYGLSNDELEAMLTAVEEARKDEGPRPLPVISLQEIILEPGFKIVAEKGWEPPGDPSLLLQRFKAALAALKNASC
ncbi:MAG: MerR family transcriptional regulator [Candidatus Eremiobacteraeota bacterium]|nr:MerR family transcriptional regulator [Candidatus Eremiobacteraeota bacterium]